GEDGQPAAADVTQHVDRTTANLEHPDLGVGEHRAQHGGDEERTADQGRALSPVVHADPHPAREDEQEDHGQRHVHQPAAATGIGVAALGGSRGRRGHGQRTARSAASTTLDTSIALVIGPTPPGLGDRKPATSSTPGATSPASLPSTRETPTSSTAAPGLTMSGVISPGEPAAATTMSARLTSAARSRVPVWHSVTVAFSLRRVSSRPIVRPTVMPRPTTATRAPFSGTS